jgi:hypothetical protein
VFGSKGLLLDLEDEQTMSWANEGEQRERDPDDDEADTVDLAELSESDEPEVILKTDLLTLCSCAVFVLYAYIIVIMVMLGCSAVEKAQRSKGYCVTAVLYSVICC